MRPDEHKQKKNTQYKKKHGIRSGKAGSDDTKSSDKGRKPVVGKKDGQKENRKRDDRDVGAKAGPGQTRASDSSDSDNESSHTKTTVFERKSFSRRQIVSNWAKYELPEEGDEAQPRGEDFNKLLASAGDAFAQFRFKDEQEWEHSVSAVDEGSQIISLDCQGLAEAVECLPLYRRLGLDKNSFTESQIILQDLEAQKKKELYDSSSGKGTQCATGDNSQIPSTNSETSVKKPKKLEGGITLSSLAKPSNLSLNFGKPQIVTNVKHNQTDSSVKSSAISRPEESLEDDLDFLLSLDTPMKTEEAKTKMQQGIGDTESNHLSSTVETEVPTNVKVSPEKKKGAPAKEEDLEDWLDSVLGE